MHVYMLEQVLVFDVTLRSFQQMLRERATNELCLCYRKIVRRAAKQGAARCGEYPPAATHEEYGLLLRDKRRAENAPATLDKRRTMSVRAVFVAIFGWGPLF